MRIAMEAIRAQLEASCRLSSTFDAIIRDYNSCLKRKREYEVRCGQLEKESTELRAETETLGTTLDTLKKRGVESEEYEEMKKRVGNLQEELIKVYKEKETLVGEKRAVNEQLEVVRDTCSRQIVEIERLNRTLSELENEKNCTQNELNKVKAAQEMTSKELQVCARVCDHIRPCEYGVPKHYVCHYPRVLCHYTMGRNRDATSEHSIC